MASAAAPPWGINPSFPITHPKTPTDTPPGMGFAPVLNWLTAEMVPTLTCLARLSLSAFKVHGYQLVPLQN